MSLITLQGGLDAVSVPRLRLTLHSLLDQGRHLLLIDLQAVVRMDGPGLGLLVGALKRARQTNGGIALVCTRAPLLEIFRITGLTRVFPCYESVAAAREGLLTVLDATPRAGQTAEATP
ncbi:STAS domain-containing protein [Streptomyces sp. NPDC006879]|uniref:STAS domain-containing protein n=1 Tax=Streptomyces sp. NPDC006879 TaxID=3364767 RepID=UPI0036AA63A7